MFPNVRIVHDYKLDHGFQIDFVIYGPIKIGIEINGVQHYEFCSKFHKTHDDFMNQLARDRRKEQLAEEAGISLVAYDASDGVSKTDLITTIRKAVDVDIDRKRQEFRNTKQKTKKQLDFQKKVNEYNRRKRKEQYEYFKAQKKKKTKERANGI